MRLKSELDLHRVIVLGSRRFLFWIGSQNGLTGLETAMILISFIIVAAILAYTTLSAGLFSTERSKENIYSGMKEASSTITLKGDVTATDTDGDQDIDEISFKIGGMLGSDPVDLTEPNDTNNDGLSDNSSSNAFVISYMDGSLELQDLYWTNSFLGASDGDNLLEFGELALITVSMTATQGVLVKDHGFTLEIIPSSGSVIIIERVLPPYVNTINILKSSGSASSTDIVSEEEAVPPVTILYLHNYPTPPSSDTDAQVNLPMNDNAPTTSSIYNYDMNYSGDSGRELKQCAPDVNEQDLRRYQNWRSGGFQFGQQINGDVDFVFWSGLDNFNLSERGVLYAYLRDYDGSTYVEIATAILDIGDWQGGSSSWVEKTITFSGVSYTIAAAHHLELKVIVHIDSARDMWFIYDTIDYPSRLILP